MSSESPDLGKGLFGYRRSAVNQIISDRDVMLRQAEGRARSAESKVSELESELASIRDRNARMDQQLERLRTKLESLAHRAEAAPTGFMDSFEGDDPAEASGPSFDPFQSDYGEGLESEFDFESDVGGAGEGQAGGDDQDADDSLWGTVPDEAAWTWKIDPEGLEPEPAAAEPGPSPEPAEEAPAKESDDLAARFLSEELGGILKAAEESASRIVDRARTTTQHQIAQSNRLWREVQNEVTRFKAWREDIEPVIHTVQSKVQGVRFEIEEVPERIRQALAPMADAMSSVDTDLAELAAAWSPPLLLAPTGLEGGDAPLSWDVRTPEPALEDPAEPEDGGAQAGDDLGMNAG